MFRTLICTLLLTTADAHADDPAVGATTVDFQAILQKEMVKPGDGFENMRNGIRNAEAVIQSMRRGVAGNAQNAPADLKGESLARFHRGQALVDKLRGELAKAVDVTISESYFAGRFYSNFSYKIARGINEIQRYTDRDPELAEKIDRSLVNRAVTLDEAVGVLSETSSRIGFGTPGSSQNKKAAERLVSHIRSVAAKHGITQADVARRLLLRNDMNGAARPGSQSFYTVRDTLKAMVDAGFPAGLEGPQSVANLKELSDFAFKRFPLDAAQSGLRAKLERASTSSAVQPAERGALQASIDSARAAEKGLPVPHEAGFGPVGTARVARTVASRALALASYVCDFSKLASPEDSLEPGSRPRQPR